MKRSALFIMLLSVSFSGLTQLEPFTDYVLYSLPVGDLRAADLGDINRDGYVDFAYIDKFAEEVVILYGNYLNVADTLVIDNDFIAPIDVKIADMNDDGRLDVVCSGSGLKVYIQNPDHSFTEQVIVPPVRNNKLKGNFPQIVDFDNDDDLDIVLASMTKWSILLYENTDLSFEEKVITEFDIKPTCLSVGDLNYDGSYEILTTSDQTPQPKLYIDNSSLDSLVNLCEESYSIQSIFTHLNNDNLLDIVCLSNYNQEINIQYQTKNGSFTYESIPCEIGQHVFDIKVFDVDGNGHKDIALTNPIGTLDVFYRYSDDDVKYKKLFSGPKPTQVHQVDYDDDGDKDLIIVSRDQSQIRLLENNRISELTIQKALFIFNYTHLRKFTFYLLFLIALAVLYTYIHKNLRLKYDVELNKQSIKSLSHRMTNQHLMNLNYEKLLDTVNPERKLDKISTIRWNKFINEYKEISPEFSNKLDSFNLSNTEFRIAILLASKLSSQEIAEIQSVNVDTVYIQRQRLAKKLGLQTAKELNNYLNDLKKLDF